MYNLRLRLILFFPFPLFIDSEIYETIYSNFRDASHFPKRRTLGENLFSLNICEVTSKQRRCKPQAPIKAGIVVRNSHISVAPYQMHHFSHA